MSHANAFLVGLLLWPLFEAIADKRAGMSAFITFALFLNAVCVYGALK